MVVGHKLTGKIAILKQELMLRKRCMVSPAKDNLFQYKMTAKLLFKKKNPLLHIFLLRFSRSVVHDKATITLVGHKYSSEMQFSMCRANYKERYFSQ